MKELDRSLRAYQQELADAVDELVRMVGLTYDGFIKHKRPFLQEAEKLGEKVHRFEKDFDEKVVQEADKDAVRLFVTLAGHIERIGDCLENVIRTVQAKIKDGTLFSDKAVSELQYIFSTAKDLLRNVKDVILTGNAVLSQHVSALSDALSKAAADFSVQHQERLVAGVCQPKHSSLYLDIVDNLRMTGWHAKEMAARIAE